MRKSRLIAAALLAAIAFTPVAEAAQYGIKSYNTVNPSGILVPQNMDAAGVIESSNGGASSSLNITASTVVKSGAGRIVRVVVTTAGSTVGNVYDSATTGSAATLIGTLPNTVGVYYFDFPVSTGILIVPGTSQVVSASYK